MNTVITIGREFGSGGRELAKKIAARLGISYYDKEIVTEISKVTELSEEYIHSIIENNPPMILPFTEARSFYMSDTLSLQSNTVYAAQSDVIKKLAESSSCIIVGRCADYILRDINPMRIFVYSDDKSKIKRCRENASENEDLTDKQLLKKINGINKNRARYYRFYTNQKWGDIRNYDLCINTSDSEIDIIADAVVKMFKKEKVGE